MSGRGSGSVKGSICPWYILSEARLLTRRVRQHDIRCLGCNRELYSGEEIWTNDNHSDKGAYIEPDFWMCGECAVVEGLKW